jgi:tetratricopeptide (TPR) repeat protein
MRRQRLTMKGILLIALVVLGLSARPAAAQDQQQDSSKQPYTMAEYNAFQTANAETKPDARVKLLDDFVTKFPNSTLMQYVYALYYPAYTQLKNYPKALDYTDKLVVLGDKADPLARLQAIQARVQLFPFVYDAKKPDAHDQLVRERDAALLGIKLLQDLKKPKDSTLTDAQFADQKKPGIALFYGAAGFADLQLKDYPAAAEAFKAALAIKSDDAVSWYRLGIAYLEMKPPQSMDGFWALAKAINLKIQGDAQVKEYLRKQILAYEQTLCDSLADAQLNELLQLAAGATERPATYTIPSADDLNKIRQSSNILTLITDLKAGGDKAKMTWLALCGAEFPEVVGKVIEVKPGTDFVELFLFTGATPEEIQAATKANLDVKVVGQPDASRLQKDDGARFSGTLASYDPDPAFMLHWDKAKVNPEDIPAEKAAPGKHAPHKVPPKKPAGKQ